jgi:hypothetical protein
MGTTPARNTKHSQFPALPDQSVALFAMENVLLDSGPGRVLQEVTLDKLEEVLVSFCSQQSAENVVRQAEAHLEDLRLIFLEEQVLQFATTSARPELL